MNEDEVKRWIRDVIEEEFSPKPIPMAKKWEGGHIVLHSGNDTQPKEIPFDVFYKKILTVRDALRVLEQKINTHEQLSPTDKLTFQSYITKAYGTLTSFNILFKDGKDRFVGAGSGKDGEEKEELTMAEAKRRLGLNEYGGD